jgi:hypothetical protein
MSRPNLICKSMPFEISYCWEGRRVGFFYFCSGFASGTTGGKRRSRPERRSLLKRRSPILFRSSSVRLSMPLRRSQPERRPIDRFSFSPMGTPPKGNRRESISQAPYTCSQSGSGFSTGFMRNKRLLKHSSGPWKRCIAGIWPSVGLRPHLCRLARLREDRAPLQPILSRGFPIR